MILQIIPKIRYYHSLQFQSQQT
uniref:Uncharacterized protein n=1 Tax=Rhizophora mucronata TaxID=61149 RepID=A0A2P2P300_RHIMU